jgi:hypothetical protein
VFLLVLGLSEFVSIDLSSGDWLNIAAGVAVACCAAALMVAWQYARRWTAASVTTGALAAVAAAAVALAIPPTAQAALLARMFRQPEARSVRAFVANGANVIPVWAWGPRVKADIPIAFSGVPAGESAQAELVNIAIDSPRGRVWSSGWAPNGRAPSTSAFMPRAAYMRLQSEHATVSGSIFAFVWKSTSIPLRPGTVTPLPGGGYCDVRGVADEEWVFCKSAFHPPYRTAIGVVIVAPTWRSPWPAEFTLDPVFTGMTHSPISDGGLLIEEEPRAWTRSDFVARGLHFFPL